MRMIEYYKNFEFEKVHAFDFFQINKLSKLKKFLSIIKSYIHTLTFTYEPSLSILDTDFLFLKTIDRFDHNILFDSIYRECSYRKEKLEIHKNIRINFYYFLHVYIYLDKCLFLIREYGVLNGIYLYIKLVSYFQFFNNIKEIKFLNLIVFSDIFPIECILVQYSNYKKYTTVTLQHGIYIDYKNMPNINMINYLYSSSKYLLAWGESTKKLFNLYNKDIIVKICGKPINLNNRVISKNEHLIGVVFDQPMFKEFNLKILKIAYEIAFKKKMKVIIRLHPSDDSKNYEFKSDLTEFKIGIEEAWFILAHTSSMIYEYLALGYSVFKFISHVPFNEIHEFLTFKNTEDILNKINVSFDFYNESLFYIKHVGEESINKYKNFFDEINVIHQKKYSIN
jgi:hypothetical protein